MTFGHSVVPARRTASSTRSSASGAASSPAKRPGEGAPPEDLREHVGLSGLVARRPRETCRLLRPTEVDQRVRELAGERR